ncbi:DUF2786 domain-containing protein [Streptomyces lydicus]|nr:DUF2786 domain-containing protein [Streptomyces lydicus]
MLAKAEATDYAEEAEALSAKAQELMARHSIDEALLDSAAAPGGQAGGPPRSASASRAPTSRPRRCCSTRWRPPTAARPSGPPTSASPPSSASRPTWRRPRCSTPRCCSRPPPRCTARATTTIGLSSSRDRTALPGNEAEPPRPAAAPAAPGTSARPSSSPTPTASATGSGRPPRLPRPPPPPSPPKRPLASSRSSPPVNSPWNRPPAPSSPTPPRSACAAYATRTAGIRAERQRTGHDWARGAGPGRDEPAAVTHARVAPATSAASSNPCYAPATPVTSAGLVTPATRAPEP